MDLIFTDMALGGAGVRWAAALNDHVHMSKW